MNKDLLAEWLMEEGVEDDDIKILKCKLILMPLARSEVTRYIYLEDIYSS